MYEKFGLPQVYELDNEWISLSPFAVKTSIVFDIT